MSSTKAQSIPARIRKLESAVSAIEKQGKAALKAYERWQTEPLARELTVLREAWKKYESELRDAREEAFEVAEGLYEDEQERMTCHE